MKLHLHIVGYLAFFLVLSSWSAMGQVAIDTNAPDPSAALDIASTDQGFLAPRISLPETTRTSLDNSNTAATGMLIYNSNSSVTGSGAHGTGFYFFDGSMWRKLGLSNDTKVYGSIFSTSTVNHITINTPIDFSSAGAASEAATTTTSVTTGRAGVYRVTFTINVEQISASGSEEVEFFLVQEETEVPGTRVYADVSVDPDYYTLTRSIYLDLPANQTFEVYPDQTNTNVRIRSGSKLSVQLID